MNAPALPLPKKKKLLIGWLLMALAVVGGGGLMIGGVIGFGQSIIKSVESITPATDGKTTIDVPKRSRVYIFTPDGTRLQSINATGPNGRVVVRDSTNNLEVNSPNSTGFAVAQFEAADPGKYTVTADGGPFSVGANVFDTDKLKLVGIGALLGAVAGITGLVLVITASVARGREKKARLAAAGNAWGQQPYAQQGYQQPGYQQPQAPFAPPPPPPPPA
jgi:hypothetical protein